MVVTPVFVCSLVLMGGVSPYVCAASMGASPGTSGLGGALVVAGAHQAPLAEVGEAVWMQCLWLKWDLNRWLLWTA